MRKPIRKSQYPLCETCHINRVKYRQCRYCSMACVPKETRAANIRKAMLKLTYHRRMKIFQAELARLTAQGRRFTREDLLVTFQTIYKRGYSAGYQRGQTNPELGESTPAA